ncbi:hypothetical protein CHX26_09015 [Porphyrobacter sp. HT-58-2]|uniref:transcription termination/antitermination protein NusG n=1 Tax=Porphyrobacter sp. HT-58-2 TaxID=2023229 RepID=UPI000CDBFE1E|nr:transcriptional activator RfaH [Porphyrobacter sp. HT-58-2]AUX69616.1 hypothetical protein CHX26_09015 [Porphyrobacter sp. HT-58-2]
MTDWFLAQVKPSADHIARRNLERQGFQTFQPLEKRTIVRRGRFADQLRPFFSGYMFVSHPAQVAPWSLVNSTYGVSRLVKFGDRPAPVPDSVINELRAACDDAGIIATAPQVSVGALVEVTSGAFTNLVGYVERLTPEQRAMVLLDIIGKHTKVTLPLTQLRVASGRTKLSRSY